MSLIGFEPIRLAILRLLVRRVNHSTPCFYDELCNKIVFCSVLKTLESLEITTSTIRDLCIDKDIVKLLLSMHVIFLYEKKNKEDKNRAKFHDDLYSSGEHKIV